MTPVCTPPISPGGALLFDRRVHFNTEYVAHRLAGVPVPPECRLIECWRRHVADRNHDPFTKPEGLPEHLHDALKIAHAVQKLRRPRFRPALYWLAGTGAEDPPVVLSSKHHRRACMEITVAFALQEARASEDGVGWMDGFGSLAVRLQLGDEVVTFVAWDTLDVDGFVKVLTHGSTAEKERARAAVRKEGWRLYREAERLKRRKRDAQGHQITGG